MNVAHILSSIFLMFLVWAIDEAVRYSSSQFTGRSEVWRHGGHATCQPWGRGRATAGGPGCSRGAAEEPRTGPQLSENLNLVGVLNVHKIVGLVPRSRHPLPAGQHSTAWGTAWGTSWGRLGASTVLTAGPGHWPLPVRTEHQQAA
jgi:hypothetical protein